MSERHFTVLFTLPAAVRLRDGSFGSIEHVVDGTEPMILLGYRAADNSEQLWRFDGCWREDGSEHPLDIVAKVITAPDGKISIEKFATAHTKTDALKAWVEAYFEQIMKQPGFTPGGKIS